MDSHRRRQRHALLDVRFPGRTSRIISPSGRRRIPVELLIVQFDGVTDSVFSGHCDSDSLTVQPSENTTVLSANPSMKTHSKLPLNNFLRAPDRFSSGSFLIKHMYPSDPCGSVLMPITGFCLVRTLLEAIRNVPSPPAKWEILRISRNFCGISVFADFSCYSSPREFRFFVTYLPKKRHQPSRQLLECIRIDGPVETRFRRFWNYRFFGSTWNSGKLTPILSAECSSKNDESCAWKGADCSQNHAFGAEKINKIVKMFHFKRTHNTSQLLIIASLIDFFLKFVSRQFTQNEHFFRLERRFFHVSDGSFRLSVLCLVESGGQRTGQSHVVCNRLIIKFYW